MIMISVHTKAGVLQFQLTETTVYRQTIDMSLRYRQTIDMSLRYRQTIDMSLRYRQTIRLVTQIQVDNQTCHSDTGRQLDMSLRYRQTIRHVTQIQVDNQTCHSDTDRQLDMSLQSDKLLTSLSSYSLMLHVSWRSRKYQFYSPLFNQTRDQTQDVQHSRQAC